MRARWILASCQDSKLLQKLNVENWRVLPSESKEVVPNCRFLREIRTYSVKLERLANEHIRTSSTEIYIFLLKKKINFLSSKHEYSATNNPDDIRSKSYAQMVFGFFFLIVHSLDQRGCLRKKIEQPLRWISCHSIESIALIFVLISNFLEVFLFRFLLVCVGLSSVGHTRQWL